MTIKNSSVETQPGNSAEASLQLLLTNTFSHIAPSCDNIRAVLYCLMENGIGGYAFCNESLIPRLPIEWEWHSGNGSKKQFDIWPMYRYGKMSFDVTDDVIRHTEKELFKLMDNYHDTDTLKGIGKYCQILLDGSLSWHKFFITQYLSQTPLTYQPAGSTSVYKIAAVTSQLNGLLVTVQSSSDGVSEPPSEKKDEPCTVTPINFTFTDIEMPPNISAYFRDWVKEVSRWYLLQLGGSDAYKQDMAETPAADTSSAQVKKEYTSAELNKILDDYFEKEVIVDFPINLIDAVCNDLCNDPGWREYFYKMASKQEKHTYTVVSSGHPYKIRHYLIRPFICNGDILSLHVFRFSGIIEPPPKPASTYMYSDLVDVIARTFPKMIVSIEQLEGFLTTLFCSDPGWHEYFTTLGQSGFICHVPGMFSDYAITHSDGGIVVKLASTYRIK